MNQNSLLQAQQHLFEAATYFVESVVVTVSQTFLPGGKRRPHLVATVGPDTVSSIIDALEAIFKLLLGLHFHDAVMVTCLCRMLEACERLIALRKGLAVPAIEKVLLDLNPMLSHTMRFRAGATALLAGDNCYMLLIFNGKMHYSSSSLCYHLLEATLTEFCFVTFLRMQVFDMFNDLPMEGGPWHLPPNPPPGWKERFQARTKIPGVLVTYAKFASEVGSTGPAFQQASALLDAVILPPNTCLILLQCFINTSTAALPFDRLEHNSRSCRAVDRSTL